MEMKLTLSVIKADIGSIGGPIRPSQRLVETVRGSHQMPLMPVPLNSGISYFDGPPVVTCAAFAIHEGTLTEAVDAFAHPFWDTIRNSVSNKAIDMRRQGFFGAAMLPMSELEYTGIVEKLRTLDQRFRVRAGEAHEL
jgi:fructose 1,6-bisphosphate aldolase/phosphatase